MGKSNLDWGNSCLFTLANIGDINLFKYWLDKKERNINVQDEDGDTPLHYAVRRGHIDIVIALLEKGAIISSNKKEQNPLQEAYVLKLDEIANVIIEFVNKGNSVDDGGLGRLVKDFIKYLKQNYQDRNSFIRFPSKHTRRADALVKAAKRCTSKKIFIDLLNNQLSLCEGNRPNSISEHIIDKRWSEVMENKYKDPTKSLYYRTINTFVFAKKLPNKNVDNGIRNAFHR